MSHRRRQPWRTCRRANPYGGAENPEPPPSLITTAPIVADMGVTIGTITTVDDAGVAHVEYIYVHDDALPLRFDQVSVEFLRTQEAIMQTGDLYAKDIYIAIDPAAGGKHSRFAMVAAIFIGRNMIVSGFICRCCCRRLSVSAVVGAFGEVLAGAVRERRKTRSAGAFRDTRR